MIICFADRRMQILSVASTFLPDGYHILHDKKISDIESGVSTLEFDLLYSTETHAEAKNLVLVGNYLLRHGRKRDTWEFYTVIDTEDDSERGMISVYAEDAGLDLLNEVVGSYEAASAQPAAAYILAFTEDSGFEIGINEISDRSRKLSWEGEATAAERVRSVATQFDAEIGYSFDIDGLRVLHKYIDIYKKRGKDTGVTLRYGQEIGRIIERRSVAHLATALIAEGGIPEGEENPINLVDYEYDDGDFYLDGGVMKCRSALKRWSRFLSENGTGEGHIVQRVTFETTNQATLCTETVTKLRKMIEPEVDYELELLSLPQNLQLGDMVNVVDDKGELYLSARLLKLEERESEDKYDAVIGDFLIRSSGISDRVTELAASVQRMTALRSRYTWIVYADDSSGTGITLDPAGKDYFGIAVNRASETPDLTDPSIYKWARISGYDGARGPGVYKVTTAPASYTTTTGGFKPSYRIALTTVMTQAGVSEALVGDILEYSYYHYPVGYVDDDYVYLGARSSIRGATGAVRYTWIAYADDAEGNGISLDPDGKAYVGMAANQTTAAADISDPSEYTWQLNTGKDGEDAVVLRIDSSRGVLFKNSVFSTSLTVTIQKGVYSITDVTGLHNTFGSGAYLEWKWRRMDDEDWRTMSVSDSHISENGFRLDITPDDVDEKIVFKCDLHV